MSFDLHAPTLLVVAAALGLILALGCFTFKKNETLGRAASRLGVGNLVLSAGCLVRIVAMQEHSALAFGGAFVLLSGGLLIHLSALRQMLGLTSMDRFLGLVSATHLLAMFASSGFLHYETYFALTTNVCTLVTSGLSIHSCKALRGRIFKPVKTALLIAFIGMGLMALVQASARLSLLDEAVTSNAVTSSLFGLTIFVVAINLAYLALYMTLQHHQIARMVSLDPLTNVLNRRGLELYLRKLLEAQSHRLTGSVLLIDVDRFKSINDNLGHAAGDHVLNSLGKVLKTHLRSDDAVGRVGGEEFALILPSVSAANAQVIAERLRLELSELKINTPDFDNISFTVSIGLAEFDIDKPVLDQLLQRSDIALYTAKANGRNRTEIWSPKLDLLMRTLRFQRSEAVISQGMASAQ